MNNVLFKRKTTLIKWRQQKKGKYLFEELLNDISNIILYVEFVFFKKCGGEKEKEPKKCQCRKTFKGAKRFFQAENVFEREGVLFHQNDFFFEKSHSAKKTVSFFHIH